MRDQKYISMTMRMSEIVYHKLFREIRLCIFRIISPKVIFYGSAQQTSAKKTENRTSMTVYDHERSNFEPS